MFELCSSMRAAPPLPALCRPAASSALRPRLPSGAAGVARRAAAPRLQHLCTTASTSDAAAPQATTVAGSGEAAALVDELLRLIEGTDGGDAVPAEVRRRADACIAALELVGRGSRPLEDPRIFGPYNVAYVSPGNKQYGQPVGGRFRTGAGKLLFRTRGLFQGVFPPDVVTNKVAFSLFGCLPGAVGLRGRLVSVPQAEGGRDEKDTAKVFFDPPVLSLPGGIHARIGPPSSVVLTTTYLDERVRLGRGSRGSLFVFTRGGAAEGAELPEVGLQRSSRGGVALVGGVVAALVVGGGWVLARAQAPAPARAAGVVCMLVGAVLAGVFYRGGIIDGEFDRPEVQPPEAAA